MIKLPQIELSEGVFNKKPVVLIDFEFDWNIEKQLRAYSNAIYTR